jgi:hypothetical protein
MIASQAVKVMVQHLKSQGTQDASLQAKDLILEVFLLFCTV